jgi:hypothetical protein
MVGTIDQAVERARKMGGQEEREEAEEETQEPAEDEASREPVTA